MCTTVTGFLASIKDIREAKLIASSEVDIIDLKNIGNGAFGGAITAALFLEHFIEKKIPWIHVDLMAWSKPNKLNNYEGGEAMGIRALTDLIVKKFP